MTKVRVVCAHDCPDMCSLVAEVADGLAARGQLLLMTCQPRTRRILEKLGVAHRAVEL